MSTNHGRSGNDRPTELGFRHHALLYETPEDLISTGAAFLSEGLARGEVPIVACRPEHNSWLEDALGHDPRLIVLDPQSTYARPARTVSLKRRLVRDRLDDGATRIRTLGEVPIEAAGQSDDWLRYEAALNVGLVGLPISGVCAYDAAALPERLRHAVEQTHPYLLPAGGSVSDHLGPNPAYVDPRSSLPTMQSNEPDPVESIPPTLELTGLDGAPGLMDVRARFRQVLADGGIPEQTANDHVRATGEVIANAVVHGRPPVVVRLWTAEDRLVCTVTDAGSGFEDALLGYAFPDPSKGRAGTGLWLARQMCDRFDVSRRRGGFTVRLTSFLHRRGVRAG